MDVQAVEMYDSNTVPLPMDPVSSLELGGFRGYAGTFPSGMEAGAIRPIAVTGPESSSNSASGSEGSSSNGTTNTFQADEAAGLLVSVNEGEVRRRTRAADACRNNMEKIVNSSLIRSVESLSDTVISGLNAKVDESGHSEGRMPIVSMGFGGVAGTGKLLNFVSATLALKL